MSEKGLNKEITGLLKRVFSRHINVNKAVYKFDVKAYNGIRNVAFCQHIDRVGITIYEKK